MRTQKSRPTSRGFLLVLEGIDGAGKTTLISALAKNMRAQGFRVTESYWLGSRVVGKYIQKLQTTGVVLTPEAYSLVHAADLADRIDTEIGPALERGEIVICDRYLYTQIARDTGLGLDPTWSESLFRFTLDPDMILYLDIPLNLSAKRVEQRIRSRKSQPLARALRGTITGFIPVQLKAAYQPTGEPMNERYKQKMLLNFQTKVVQAYQKMISRFHMIRVDATMPMDLVLRHVLPQILSAIESKSKPV